MPLAYYSSQAATTEFWTEHWGAHSVEELLAVARTSPLTRLIMEALPARGILLEAGCGLGQYVLLFRECGYHAIGVDSSVEALHQCQKRAGEPPLAAMDLCQLGFRSGAFAAYISLGVVEHDPEGPDRILQEARRVLQPGGLLVLSVPYMNLVRRLGAPWIRRRNQQLAEGGGKFYQFVFSGGEARTFIERNGFRVLGATPYDPARLLRKAWRRASRGTSRAGNGSGPMQSDSIRSSRSALSKGIKRLLYTRAGLHGLGHMILFTAVKR